MNEEKRSLGPEFDKGFDFTFGVLAAIATWAFLALAGYALVNMGGLVTKAFLHT